MRPFILFLLAVSFGISATPSNGVAVTGPQASTWVMLTMGVLLMAMSILRRQAKSGSKNDAQER